MEFGFNCFKRVNFVYFIEEIFPEKNQFSARFSIDKFTSFYYYNILNYLIHRSYDKKLPEMSSTFYHVKFPLETCIFNLCVFISL